MELHAFIRDHMQSILIEWDAFAKTMTPARDMTLVALRDHAKEILLAIALDIETSQSIHQQLRKSQGLLVGGETEATAASVHGVLREQNHFSLIELSAEFRALRATVLRLWLPLVKTMSPQSVQEMIRFNEAIDQALAESIASYAASADHTRELFLAILGHDLRAPLATMMASAELLSKHELPKERVPEIGLRVRRGAQQMSSMVDDLLGYTREKLGVGIPTTIRSVDLLGTFQTAITDATALHPGTPFELTTSGSLNGLFDEVRITQLITNLLKNAAQYGTPDQTVKIDIVANAEEVQIRVINHGPVIPQESLLSVFQPLIQLATEGDADPRPRTSLGLGLYVARETALAHGGTISVESNQKTGTVFTVRLPKNFNAKIEAKP